MSAGKCPDSRLVQLKLSGTPFSSVCRRVSSSPCASIASAILSRSRRLSDARIVGHGPSSKARRAAPTASSTSLAVAQATEPAASLLAGCKTVNRSPLPARCSPSISSVPKRTRSFPSANAATPLSRALCVKRSTALICTFASVSICASIRQESGSFGVGRSMTSFLSCSSTAASRRYSWPRSVEPVRGDTTASGHPSRTRRLLDQSAKPALPEFGATLPEAVGTLRLRGLAPHR